MGYGKRFADELGKRDNPKLFETQIGEVLSVSPLRIQVEQGVIIEEGQGRLGVASRLLPFERQSEIKGSFTGDITIDQNPDDIVGSIEGDITISATNNFNSNVLIAGDIVQVLPRLDGQFYYVLDKVVRL